MKSGSATNIQFHDTPTESEPDALKCSNVAIASIISGDKSPSDNRCLLNKKDPPPGGSPPIGDPKPNDPKPNDPPPIRDPPLPPREKIRNGTARRHIYGCSKYPRQMTKFECRKAVKNLAPRQNVHAHRQLTSSLRRPSRMRFDSRMRLARSQITSSAILLA